MKKHYLLTMLLSLFCFAGFASAQEEVTWDLVYSNTLSSTTSSEVVLEDPIYVNGAWSVQNSGASQALIDEGVSDNNKRFGPYVILTSSHSSTRKVSRATHRVSLPTALRAKKSTLTLRWSPPLV